MARRDLRTPAAPIDLIDSLRDGKLQLRGVPGTSQSLGTLLTPRDLQTEALKAECARRFEQFLVAEAVPRFLPPAPGAERLGALSLTRRPRLVTTLWRNPSVEIALLFVSARTGGPAHVSSSGIVAARRMPNWSVSGLPLL
jgi:hypothetical protein